MESLNNILGWLTEHEAAFSALAALVVIFGVVFSPLGAGVRALLSGNKNTNAGAPINAPGNPLQTENAEITGQDFLNTPPPLITDKPSIAVLPFVNMSHDKDKEFFADGMTEDIITGLSCDSRLFVIARNSTFAYKGQSPDIRKVGKELGVGYVLEGSVRPVNERLRITVQLVETETGSHVWADKIDRPVEEIFAVQDEVVDSLVSTLCTSVKSAEARRTYRQAPENLKAWELCVQAEMLWVDKRSPESVEAARKLCERATELEPNYAMGWAANAYFSSVDVPFLLTPELGETASRTGALINQAVTLTRDDATVLGYAGNAAYLIGKADTAIDYLERSLALNPNSGQFRMAYANALLCASRWDEALVQYELFFRQSPRDPNMELAYLWQSLGFLSVGDYEQARQAALSGIKHQPLFAWPYVSKAMALNGLQQTEEIPQLLQNALESAPQFSAEKVAAFFRFVFKDQAAAERLCSLVPADWPA